MELSPVIHCLPDNSMTLSTPLLVVCAKTFHACNAIHRTIKLASCSIIVSNVYPLHSYRAVINALSDLHHPLQTLADLMTLKEHFGNLKGKTVAWVGDGNNVLHDLMIGSIKMGMNVHVATPAGYSANAAIITEAKALAIQEGVKLVFTSDPKVAVAGANVVVTDTWISMGQEEEAKQRKIDFAGYQVTDFAIICRVLCASHAANLQNSL
jgi:ornithine carbamoyltransferase